MSTNVVPTVIPADANTKDKRLEKQAKVHYVRQSKSAILCAAMDELDELLDLESDDVNTDDAD